ncbi:hypothetical protein Vadar_012192 [Vaccinium darrowii]|uniref:Uncharacterized protein n=1 Tax=Vaccinium darrowii TaxID=229202 RepID=A0ACB7XH12_9ERIC|nr:hypothetical protein Vadar_012192 [Vaccinium darrowii]
MSSRMLFSDVYKIHNLLLLVALFWGNCHAKTSPNCVSYCGNIDIRHPFRVKGDPENCGNKKYELDCEHNRPVLHLFASGKYYVHEINYDDYSIRLVDVGLQQGNCSSLPLYSLSDLNFTTPNSDATPYSLMLNDVRSVKLKGPFDLKWYWGWEIAVALWVDCEMPVEISPFYTDRKTSASSCIGKNFFFILVLGKEEIFLLFVRDKLISFGCAGSVQNSKLEYGFELSWLSILCEQCQGDCFPVWPSYHTVACYKYCNKFLENRSFRCRLEIFYHEYVASPLKITGFILGARTLSGFLGLFALLIYKFRRRNWSVFDTIECFLQSQNNLMPIRYSYSEVKKMTKGFKDKLGEGGYGSVYKGKLRSGSVAAIKVLGKSKANGQEFINEVATIGRIHHVNVV